MSGKYRKQLEKSDFPTKQTVIISVDRQKTNDKRILWKEIGRLKLEKHNNIDFTQNTFVVNLPSTKRK